MEGMEIEVGRAEKFSQNARITFISYIIVAYNLDPVMSKIST